MSSYASTRGGDATSLAEAVFRGLAADGGLYVPLGLGRLSASPPPPGASLVDVARWARPALLPDVSLTSMERVLERAFTFPTPLVEVADDLFVLELFHGPTLAFKDVGARFMAALMCELDADGADRTILVATSGDTGGAVADAFHGEPGCRVAVLFPKDGISDRQRRQMTTLGGNVVALAVRGSFDDCQRMVKEAFLAPDVRDRHRLTSANSINVARLLPQALYYLYAAVTLGWERSVRFVVPSGNLGNLCAGLVAKRIGMDRADFVAATNANRGFVDFLDHGTFEPRPSVPTESNAMDVGDPSNLERIRWLYRDRPEELGHDVLGESVTDAEASAFTSSVHAETGYLLDPHTAVAYVAASRRRNTRGPTVVLSTAHPAKFPEAVERATGVEVPVPPALRARLAGRERFTEIESDLDALRTALDEGIA